MKPAQISVAEQIANDFSPVHEWAQRMERLVPRLYEHDLELSRKIEVLIGHIASSAADLDCIGTDDPAAPKVGSPAREVLAYFFRRWPEEGAEFRRLLSRADQLIGRRDLLEIVREA
jgi:hypothetical protein